MVIFHEHGTDQNKCRLQLTSSHQFLVAWIASIIVYYVYHVFIIPMLLGWEKCLLQSTFLPVQSCIPSYMALSTFIPTFLVQNAGNQAAYFSHTQDLAHGPVLFDCSFTALVDHFPLGLELLLIRPSHYAHRFMLMSSED